MVHLLIQEELQSRQSDLYSSFMSRILFSALCLLLSSSVYSQQPLKTIRQASKPGAEHAKLDFLEGEWKIRIQYQIRPGSNPESASGKAEFRWILGKRFMEQTVDGKGIAGNFEGRGTTGYDNVLGHYAGVWVDTMNSGVTRSKGEVDAGGSVFKFSGTTTDALEKKEVAFSSVLEKINADELRYTVASKSGEKVLEIHYRRK